MAEVDEDPKQRTAYGPAHAPPRLSPDGRRRRNGQQLAPARPPVPGNAGWMAGCALCAGASSLMIVGVLALGTQAGVEGWGTYSLAAVILTPAVFAAPGLVLGILALVFPGHGHDLRSRQIVALIGIVLALLSAIAVFFSMQAINSWNGP